MDNVERAIWQDVHIHESGCWGFTGPRWCSVIRLLADLAGESLPVNKKMFRMPECTLGSECVNPEHVGTSRDLAARQERTSSKRE